MKMFKIYVGMFFLMMHGMSHADIETPQAMAAYKNHIIKADFNIQDNGVITIQLQCAQMPICYYAPRSFEESNNNNIKRFFLPRTQWIDASLADFMQELNSALEPFGITCSYNQTVKTNFGLELIFKINSDEYEIKKTVDTTNKIVSFEIRLK